MKNKLKIWTMQSMAAARNTVIAAFVLLSGSIISVYAQDLVILRDGNVIEARVTEVSPTEIRYRRFNHLDGPVIVIARADVLSIRYENKTVEIMNPLSGARQEVEIINPLSGARQEADQPDIPASFQPGEPTLLQQALNRLPAIFIAGNNLKFEFSGDTWIARLNGENFFAGTVEFEATIDGGILTLRQTHIWPAAAGRTAGRIASFIPGGGAAAGALNTAVNITGEDGSIEMSGPVIVLAYRAGPPASLRLIRSRNRTADTGQTEKTANVRNNWLSVGMPMAGVVIKYERMLHSHWSFGVDAHFQTFGFSALRHGGFLDSMEFGVNLTARVFPFGRVLYIGTGIGVYGYWLRSGYNYGYDEWVYYDPGNPGLGGYWNWNYSSRVSDYIVGFAVTPELGVRLDAGRPGGFFMDIGLKFPQIFGRGGYSWSLVPFIGFGGAF